MNLDPDSPDYNDTNLGDPRDTPEEKEIERLTRINQDQRDGLTSFSVVIRDLKADVSRIQGERDAALGNRDSWARRAEDAEHALGDAQASFAGCLEENAEIKSQLGLAHDDRDAARSAAGMAARERDAYLKDRDNWRKEYADLHDAHEKYIKGIRDRLGIAVGQPFIDTLVATKEDLAAARLAVEQAGLEISNLRSQILALTNPNA